MINAYGVWGPRTRPDGTTVEGIRRMTFLIDTQGVIKKVYPTVNPEEHAQEIEKDLAALT